MRISFQWFFDLLERIDRDRSNKALLRSCGYSRWFAWRPIMVDNSLVWLRHVRRTAELVSDPNKQWPSYRVLRWHYVEDRK